MLKPVQHDNKKSVIPNSFRNLEFGNDNKSIVFALIMNHELQKIVTPDSVKCPFVMLLLPKLSDSLILSF